jgi:hypothetical protein
VVVQVEACGDGSDVRGLFDEENEREKHACIDEGVERNVDLASSCALGEVCAFEKVVSLPESPETRHHRVRVDRDAELSERYERGRDVVIFLRCGNHEGRDVLPFHEEPHSPRLERLNPFRDERPRLGVVRKSQPVDLETGKADRPRIPLAGIGAGDDGQAKEARDGDALTDECQVHRSKGPYPNETAYCFVDGADLVPIRDVGTTLAGWYLREEVIGEGGMATVYRATQNLTGRSSAIKILNAALARETTVR